MLLSDIKEPSGCFRSGEREDFDAELLEKFVFVEHHAGECERTVAQLHQAHVLPVLEHAGDSAEIFEVGLEDFIGDLAGRDVCELDLISLQDLGHCEHSALCVEETSAVRFVMKVGGIGITEIRILDCPEEGGEIHELRESSGDFLTAEVQVQDEQCIRLLSLEVFGDGISLGVVVHHAVFIPSVEGDEFDMLVREVLKDIRKDFVLDIKSGFPAPHHTPSGRLTVSAGHVHVGHITATRSDSDLNFVTNHI